MKPVSILNILVFICSYAMAQKDIKWKNVDSLYGPLPSSVHVYFTDSQTDTGKFRAFYVEAQLNDRLLDFTVDTTWKRRLTPAGFYEKNNRPLLVVNGTFFSFESNQNLNMVIKDGRLVSFNQQSIPGRKTDTLTYRHAFTGTFGIDGRRKADIAWTFTDSIHRKIYAGQLPIMNFRDSNNLVSLKDIRSKAGNPALHKWKMRTAIGGGPVVLTNGTVMISNNEELKFSGKAIGDKHPRTAIGYTADNRLIILVIEGRNPQASGASLEQEALLLKGLGCIEGLNLDGGGSSCLLINGRETIKPSDKEGQRAVPAVFMIRQLNP